MNKNLNEFNIMVLATESFMKSIPSTMKTSFADIEAEMNHISRPLETKNLLKALFVKDLEDPYKVDGITDITKEVSHILMAPEDILCHPFGVCQRVIIENTIVIKVNTLLPIDYNDEMSSISEFQINRFMFEQIARFKLAYALAPLTSGRVSINFSKPPEDFAPASNGGLNLYFPRYPMKKEHEGKGIREFVKIERSTPEYRGRAINEEVLFDMYRYEADKSQMLPFNSKIRLGSHKVNIQHDGVNNVFIDRTIMAFDRDILELASEIRGALYNQHPIRTNLWENKVALFNEYNRRLHEAEECVKRHKRRLITANNEYENYVELVEQIEKEIEEGGETTNKIQSILNNDKRVKSILLKKDKIIIQTNPLKIEPHFVFNIDKNKVNTLPLPFRYHRYLGPIRIDVDLREPRHCQIRFANHAYLIPCLGPRHVHPHIFEQGRTNHCLSETGIIVQKYVEDKDIVALVNTLITFLTKVTHSDEAGIYYTNLLAVTEDNKLVFPSEQYIRLFENHGYPALFGQLSRVLKDKGEEHCAYEIVNSKNLPLEAVCDYSINSFEDIYGRFHDDGEPIERTGSEEPDYEECREERSARDCAGCDNPECPYYDDDDVQCYRCFHNEGAELWDCMACSNIHNSRISTSPMLITRYLFHRATWNMLGTQKIVVDTDHYMYKGSKGLEFISEEAETAILDYVFSKITIEELHEKYPKEQLLYLLMETFAMEAFYNQRGISVELNSRLLRKYNTREWLAELVRDSVLPETMRTIFDVLLFGPCPDMIRFFAIVVFSQLRGETRSLLFNFSEEWEEENQNEIEDVSNMVLTDMVDIAVEMFKEYNLDSIFRARFFYGFISEEVRKPELKVPIIEKILEDYKELNKLWDGTSSCPNSFESRLSFGIRKRLEEYTGDNNEEEKE